METEKTIKFEIKDIKTQHIYKEKMTIKDFILFVYENSNKYIFQISEINETENDKIHPLYYKG